jgi:hypothetical protein
VLVIVAVISVIMCTPRRGVIDVNDRLSTSRPKDRSARNCGPGLSLEALGSERRSESTPPAVVPNAALLPTMAKLL